MNDRQARARARVIRQYPDASVHSDGRDYIVKLTDGTILGHWSMAPGDAWMRAEKHLEANAV